MGSITGSFGKPFKEQVDFFKEKLKNKVQTERWDVMQKEAHDRAFTVAGATKAELLDDLAGAVDKAISKGTSLEEFRNDFDEIVNRHGWQYRGGFDWRTRVIYQTNLATSYAAGRLVQLQQFPFWVYKHSGKRNFRPKHKAWDGLTLSKDDPWWQTHFPPNGWGCGCRVHGVRREEDAKRFGGKSGPAPDNGIDPKTGTPKGIDKGWDYMPGASRLPKQDNSATPPIPPKPPKKDGNKPKDDPPKKDAKPEDKPEDKPENKPPQKDDKPEKKGNTEDGPNKQDESETKPEKGTPPQSKPESTKPENQQPQGQKPAPPPKATGNKPKPTQPRVPGYSYGAGWFHPIADKIQTLSPPLGASLASIPTFQLGIQLSYENWLNRLREGERLQPVMVGAFSPDELKLLKSVNIEPTSAQILLKEGLLVGPKATRHVKKGDAIPDTIWDKLPEMMRAPVAVLLDPKSNKVFYVLPHEQGKVAQIIVEVDFKIKRPKSSSNMVVSAYVQKVSDLQGAIKGGRLILLKGRLK